MLDGEVKAVYRDGDLRLDYVHDGLARVLVTGGGRRPLLLLLGTDEAAAGFWRAETESGPVLVRGTELVRSASASGDTLSLAADTAAGQVEVFAPPAARRLRIGAEDVRVTRRPSPASMTPAGPPPITPRPSARIGRRPCPSCTPTTTATTTATSGTGATSPPPEPRPGST
ncbi:beta-galactosidase domain 3-containing protein [Nonomuraea sp. B19D2]|uniref:beta-galactosidase domain 3-containing protein n=1 Tax=Nonomuraea sp. B19D2 TaxID=3159561 RepID=UPI0032D9C977